MSFNIVTRMLGCAFAASVSGSLLSSESKNPLTTQKPSFRTAPLTFEDFTSPTLFERVQRGSDFENVKKESGFSICKKIVDMIEEVELFPEKPIVILTGYNGRLGPHVAKSFENAGYTVIGLGRGCKETDIVSEYLTLKKVDLEKKADIKELLDFIEETYHTKEIASVVHLAGLYGFEKNPDPDRYYAANAKTTENMLRLLTKKGFRVGQFVLGSSQAVYASSPKGKVITEESPLRDDYPYAASKCRAEQLVKQAPMPTVTLRIPSVYENNCNNEGLAKTITLVALKSHLARFYPGKQHENGWSYMHIEDFVRAVQCIVDERERLAKENPHVIFHVGEEGCTTQPELQDAIAKALGRSGFTSFEISQDMGIKGTRILDFITSGHAPVHEWMVRALGRVYIDTSAFRKAFPEYRVEHDVLETMQSMVESYIKDPEEFAKRHKMSDAEMEVIRLCSPIDYSRITPERFALCSPE